MQPPADSHAGSYDGASVRPGVTIQEASQVLGVSPTTIRRWVREGKVRSERVSRPQGYVILVELPERPLPNGSYQPSPSASGGLSTVGPADVERAEAMALYSARLLEPLVARLADQEQTIRQQAERLGQQTERLAQQDTRLSQQADRVTQLERELAERGPWWRRVLGR